MQRSGNGTVNRFQNLNDVLQLFYSFFESGELFWRDHHAGLGYGGLVGLKPRVKGASSDTGLSADVGDAFSVLVTQDELTFLVNCVFHMIFLLNVDVVIVAFGGGALKKGENANFVEKHNEKE